MINKEEFLKKDRLVRGIASEGNFRIAVVKSTDVVKEAKRRHNLSLVNTILLGRSLTGGILLASNLKGEERINMRLEGKGPVGQLSVEATSNGEIRGYAQHPEAELNYDKTQDIGEALGLGVLSFSKILYNEAQPITGTVELQKGDVNTDIAHYLFQSEQVPSAISIDVGIDEHGEVTEAGGLLIQAMPGAEDQIRDQLEENVRKMLPLPIRLQQEEYIDDIMHSVMAPYDVKEMDRYPVHFFCRCNRERFKNALAMVNLEELEDMKHEGQELVCHYCAERYQVSKDEIRELVDEAKVRMN